jgi:two-component system, cell cycle response regulator
VNANFNDIALVGFSSFEFSTFETFFRLVSARRPRPYRAVRTGDQARLVIVDGGSESLVMRLVGLLRPNQRAIIVGSTTYGTSWQCIPRPINLSQVLGLVDRSFAEGDVQMMAAALATSTQRAKDIVSTPARPAAPAIAPINPNALAANASPTVFADNSGAALPATRESSYSAQADATHNASASVRHLHAVPPAKVGANILVVDDSDVALKFIHSRLSAFGFSVDLASSGEEALVRVSENEYAFVFLDVMMHGLDGYQTCKAIKKRKFENGHAPVVVMLTSRGGTVDKVRGTFAGCDAYLTKPLDESKMLRVLLKHDSALADQIDTYTRPYTPSVPGGSTAGDANQKLEAGSGNNAEDEARRAMLERLDQSSAIR